LELATSTPEWVYVDAAAVRQARLSGDDTAGRRTVYGSVVESRPSGEDFYVNHDFQDFNVLVHPDPAYADVLSSANLQPGEEFNIIEGEWEVQEIPLWAWPAAGDRVRVSGNWNWDCGHWGDSGASPLLVYDPAETLPDLLSPGSIRGETTELHPLYEVSTLRNDAAGILGRHGARLLAQLDVWLNGDGAGAHSIEECALRGINEWVLARTVCSRNRDIGGAYRYTMNLPPRPSHGSKLVVNPIVVRTGTDPELASVPINVTPDPTGGTVTVAFTIPRGRAGQRFGLTAIAGWSNDVRAVHHVVSLDQIHISRSLDGDSEPNLNPGNVPAEQTSAPGEWVLYANVSGNWVQIPKIAQVNDDATIGLGITLDFYLPPGVQPTLFVSGHECDEPLLDCIHEGTSDTPNPLSSVEAGFNDRPGRIEIGGAGIPMTYGRFDYHPPANPDPTNGNEDLSDAICGLDGCYQLRATWTTTRS
jgi:hypothetical protein